MDPLVWNRATGNVVGGHQRLQVVKDMGWKDVAVSVVNIKNKKKEKALNLALYKVSGSWDDERLASILEELSSDADLLLSSGFSEDEMRRLLESAQPPKEFVEFDANLETDFECPKCHYQWSGKLSPKNG